MSDHRRARTRANGEGSIYPYKNGCAAYVWVTTPDGEKKRKYVYGKDRDETHGKWLKLHAAAKAGPVVTKSQTLGEYLAYWLKDVVTEPDYAPLTVATYRGHARLYLIPGLGKYKLDTLSVRNVRMWLNDLRKTCQCCAQEKDARRPAAKRRCCAVGECCQSPVSERTAQDILKVLRASLTNAIREELITKNVAALVKVNKARKTRKVKPWTVDEARQFLESARDADTLYTAYVLILVLGLRKGEVLGLTWELVDLDKGELFVGQQLQRVSGRLLRRETKTESSEAPLPLPDICVAALKLRREQQASERDTHARRWTDTGLVFTTRYGTPIEPRNFNRSFDYRINKSGVRRITVHGTRKTCGTLLAALDVHPRVAMQILRHSRIAVTMEIYTEATSEATRAALRKLGDFLGAERSDMDAEYS